jgi:hypothetical protein
MIEEVGGTAEELDLTNAHLPTLEEVTLNPALKVKLSNLFCIISQINIISDPLLASPLFYSSLTSLQTD